MRAQSLGIGLLAIGLTANFATAAPQSDTGTQGWLGVALMPSEHGAEVLRVMPDSPAEAVGLKRRDVIVEVDGEEISNVIEFVKEMRARFVGDRVQLKIVRDGLDIEESVTLTDRPERWSQPNFAFMRRPKVRLGVALQPLGEGLRDYFGVDEGVLIAEVVTDSAAERAGLKAGDVITAVDNQPVTSHRDVIEVLSKHEPADRVSVRVMRRGNELVLDTELDEAPKSFGSSTGHIDREQLEKLGKLGELGELGKLGESLDFSCTGNTLNIPQLEGLGERIRESLQLHQLPDVRHFQHSRPMLAPGVIGKGVI